MEDRNEAIRETLLNMDAMDDDQWTNDGAPKVEVVAEAGNFDKLTRAEIIDAAPKFSREDFDVTVEKEENTDAEEEGVREGQEEVNTMGYQHPEIVAAQEAYDQTVADLAAAKEAEKQAGEVLNEAVNRLVRQKKDRHQTTHDIRAVIEASNKARAARVAEFQANKALLTGKAPRSPLDEAKAKEKKTRPLMTGGNG